MKIQRILVFFFLQVFVTHSIAQFGPGACVQIPNSQTCIDATPCKTDASGTTVCLAGATLPAHALAVPQSCWKWQYQYACNDNYIDTCTPYRENPACSVVKSECIDYLGGGGVCDENQYTYKCQTKAAQTTTQLNCVNSVIDPTLVPAPSNTNSSFIQAAIAQEILNEGQTYAQGDNFFWGVKEACHKGYAGIKNCCKSTPGGKTNSATAQAASSLAFSAVKYVGSQAVSMVSPYVYDAMYNVGIWTSGMTESFVMAQDGSIAFTGAASGGFSVGAFGFTYSTTATTGLLDANMTIAGGADTGYLYFNPYVFVAVVVIMIITSLASCTQDEQMLALHRGANLSTFINEECSNKVLGTCMEYQDNYCSFNSVLARIINIQGKRQLGLPIEDCAGITAQQLSAIDFSKIDFTDFVASIMQNAQQNAPTDTTLQNGYGTSLTGKNSGSSQSSSSAVLPAYTPTTPAGH
ncbi:conjugal transfer protein TraN [Pelomonas sp. HMWF004]|nr:conjugal transfer protein TraN [Pelomonas sp. HMWF004]